MIADIYCASKSKNYPDFLLDWTQKIKNLPEASQTKLKIIFK